MTGVRSEEGMAAAALAKLLVPTLFATVEGLPIAALLLPMICPIWCIVSSTSWFVDFVKLNDAGFITNAAAASRGFFRRLADFRLVFDVAACDRSYKEFICCSKSSFSVSCLLLFRGFGREHEIRTSPFLFAVVLELMLPIPLLPSFRLAPVFPRRLEELPFFFVCFCLDDFDFRFPILNRPISFDWNRNQQSNLIQLDFNWNGMEWNGMEWKWIRLAMFVELFSANRFQFRFLDSVGGIQMSRQTVGLAFSFIWRAESMNELEAMAMLLERAGAFRFPGLAFSAKQKQYSNMSCPMGWTQIIGGCEAPGLNTSWLGIWRRFQFCFSKENYRKSNSRKRFGKDTWLQSLASQQHSK